MRRATRKSPTFFIPFCEEKSKAGKRVQECMCGGERCVGSREERKKKQRERRARDKETPGIEPGMKTAQDFFACVCVYTCTRTVARMCIARKRTCAGRARVFTRKKVFAVTRPTDAWITRLILRAVGAFARTRIYARILVCPYIIRACFSPLPFLNRARDFTLDACFCSLIDADIYCITSITLDFNAKIYIYIYLFNCIFN